MMECDPYATGQMIEYLYKLERASDGVREGGQRCILGSPPRARNHIRYRTAAARVK